MTGYRISVWHPEGLNSETREARIAEFLAAILNEATEALVAWADVTLGNEAAALTERLAKR